MTGQHEHLGPTTERAEDQSPYALFGRAAERIAGELLTLASLPEAARMQPDAYSWDEIRHVADTLRGMALRCALEAGDRELVWEVIDRTADHRSADDSSPWEEPVG
jgi:hypothetical protein